MFAACQVQLTAGNASPLPTEANGGGSFVLFGCSSGVGYGLVSWADTVALCNGAGLINLATLHINPYRYTLLLVLMVSALGSCGTGELPCCGRVDPYQPMWTPASKQIKDGYLCACLPLRIGLMTFGFYRVP